MKTKNFFAPLFAAFLLLAATASFAQAPPEPVRRNTFFLELGGNGMFYSLNYDRILLNRDNWKLSGRVGAMYLPPLNERNRHMVGGPVEISYLRGRGRHFLELGLGGTVIYDTYALSNSRVNDLAVMAVARIGYRHQKPEGGFFYKVGFTPLLGALYNEYYPERGPLLLAPFAYPLVGLGFGYTLKR